MGEVVEFKFTFVPRRKQEYSPYFYQMAAECVALIENRQYNQFYALNRPREAVRQFIRQTNTMLEHSCGHKESTRNLLRLLRTAKIGAALLQQQLGTLGFMKFEYSADMEELFHEIMSRVIGMENVLSPILIRPVNTQSIQMR